MPAWRRSRASKKSQIDLEKDEDNMASRLQLELGKTLVCYDLWAMAMTLEFISEYDKVTPKAKKSAGEKATEFRCVSFDEWLLLFIEVFSVPLFRCTPSLTYRINSQYAFLLTKRDQYSLADEVLRHVAQSVVFQGPVPADTLRIALIGKSISLVRIF